MKKIHLERLIAVLLLMAGIYLYKVAGEFPPDSDIFPKITIVVIIALSALMFIVSFRRKTIVIDPARYRLPSMDTIRPYLIFLCCIIYMILTGIIGFFPTSILMGVIILLILRAKKLKIQILTLGGTLLFVYILFVHFLQVPLPKGIIFD